MLEGAVSNLPLNVILLSFPLKSEIRIKHWRKHGGAPPEGVGQVAGQAAAILRKATERRRGGFAGRGFGGRGSGGAGGAGVGRGNSFGGRGGLPGGRGFGSSLGRGGGSQFGASGQYGPPR